MALVLLGRASCRSAGPSRRSPSALSSRRPRRPKHCVGWAIAGSLGGAAVGFYGAAGIAAAAGSDVFHSDTALGAAVAAEFVGFIAGPIASCRLSDDPR